MSARARAIAITGHRPAGLGARGPARIRAAIRDLVGHHPGALWLAGGAVGADQIAADELLNLGQRLQLVLPFPVALQAARWAPQAACVLAAQVARAEAVDIVRDTYNVGAYHERNRRLVQRAELLVAFHNGRPFGGTASTIREAHRQHVPVLVVPM